MTEKDMLKRINFSEVGSEDEERIGEFFDAMGAESRALFNRRDYNRRGVLKYCTRPDPTRRYWIAELDGKAISDEIVSDIFSKFCVGK